jgi:hypothetical protein
LSSNKMLHCGSSAASPGPNGVPRRLAGRVLPQVVSIGRGRAGQLSIDVFGREVRAEMETKEPESTDAVEVATRWGLVTLAVLAMLGAALRVFAPGAPSLPERLDQTTLLYLGVAGVLLLLRQVKTFSLGQLKLEMIEKLREQQQRQEQQLADIRLILPLLLQDKEVRHIQNLSLRQTEKYQGSGALREELRRLVSIGLISKKAGRTIGNLRDGVMFDLADNVELTDLGQEWARLIQTIRSGDAKAEVGHP